MKHLIVPLAATTTLLFLLFSPPTTTATDGDDIIYDVMGQPLVPGQGYYIVPFKYENVGGGFRWEQDTSGHYHVSQVFANTDFGSPIAFFPKSSSQNTVTLSTDLNIVFPQYYPPKVPSNVWKVVTNEDSGISYVELGGEKGATDSSSSWFTIAEHDGSYLIKYCPKSGEPSVCGALAVVSPPDDRRWLGVISNVSNALTFMLEPTQFFQKNNAKYVI